MAGRRLARCYRLDLEAAYARVAAVDRTAVVIRFGAVEYAERGSGEPLLQDDPLVSYDAAQRAAGRIPGARLVSVERGGHLILGGHREAVGRAVAAFLARVRLTLGRASKPGADSRAVVEEHVAAAGRRLP